MPRISDGRIALISLIAFAAWLLIALPLFYLPSEGRVHGEILGVKYGEWLLFSATMGLWWATWRLVRGAEKTAERQLRAYITIESGGVGLSGTSGIGASAVFRNAGQTPAYNFRTWSNLLIGDIHLQNPYPSPPSPIRGAKSICGPGQEANVGAHLVVTEDHLTAIRARRQAIFFSGIAQYDDAYGKSRHFIFRCRITGEPERHTLPTGTIQTGWALAPDPMGYEGN
ncbi:MAG: hypothetical protein QOI05_2363 [Bradyrhizobium sp.]|nr:hypothetical protein [Bradyrhizobium sp.]